MVEMKLMPDAAALELLYNPVNQVAPKRERVDV